MVHVPTLMELRSHYEKNFQKYVKEHPGEYVHLDMSREGIREKFYKTLGDYCTDFPEHNKIVFGPGKILEKIPKKSHKYIEGNKSLEMRLDENIKYCPNDGKTELPPGQVSAMHGNGKVTYREITECPDCYCRVFRKPSDSAIKQFENALKKRVFK